MSAAVKAVGTLCATGALAFAAYTVQKPATKDLEQLNPRQVRSTNQPLRMQQHKNSKQIAIEEILSIL
jgi:hypothetical protein